MLPMTVFGASVSMGNMTSGTKVIPGVGAADKKWMGYGDIHGYKVSVWFAPTVAYDSNGLPVYDWTAVENTPNAPFKIGKTVYLRKSEINFNGGNMPSFWSTQSIFEQVTRGQGYIKTEAKLGNIFDYYITPNLSVLGRTQDSIENGWTNGDGSTFEGMKSIYNKFYNYLQLMKNDGLQDTFGYKQLYDYVSRMYDADKSEYNKYINYDLSNLLNSDTGKAGDRMSPEGFILPLTKMQTGNKTNEEVKSYFLNPLVLNQIAYLSYDASGGMATWSYEDFLWGRYHHLGNNVYEYPNGQDKIYVEPVRYRFFNGQAGVMSWRDAVYEYKDKNYNGGTIYASVAQFQAGGALALEAVDKSLVEKSSGKYLGQDGLSPMISSDGEAKTAAKNLLNTLGVGVLTSPSLNDYPLNEPMVIKHYVEIESIDSEGRVNFKKAKDSKMQSISRFYFGKDGTFENVPVIPEVEEDSDGVAILNDIFTTNKYEGLKVDSSTEWTDTELPVNMGIDLGANILDIAGYCYGKVTGSKQFIEDFTGNALIGISQGYEGEEALTSFAYFNAFCEYEAELERINMVLTEEEELELRMYYIEKYAIRKDVFEDYHALMRQVGVKEYITNKQIKIGQLQFNSSSWPSVKIIPDEEYIPEGDNLIASNTLVLRYLYMPKPKQLNVVEIVDSNGNHKGYKFSTNPLIVKPDGSVNVQNPEFPGIEKYPTPELVRWTTNSEYPVKELVDSNLPTQSEDGKSGSEVYISNYPSMPATHNLYVHWKIEEPIPIIQTDVPQWRLSKFFKAYSETAVGNAGMGLTLRSGCCGGGLYNPGAWDYSVINPTGLSNWIHAFTRHSGERPYVSSGSPSVSVSISADVNAIKSTDVSGLRAAKWIDSGSQAGLLNYSIQSAKKGTGSSPNIYTKDSTMSLGVKNNTTYINWYTVQTSSDPHDCYTTSLSIGPSSWRVKYEKGVVTNVISFARYNQVASRPAFTIGSNVVNNNGYTAIKYQQDKALNIYPEYGMLFDNDSNQESIKWMVSDQARLVKPVVYQTLEHKVYVEPSSTGTIATDTRAKQKANAIGESGKPVLYKGAPVNSTFKVYRDNAKNKVGMLTVKTFALDIDTSKVSYDDWGNSFYNGVTLNAHKSLVENIDNLGKATVSENLIVSNLPNGATNYIGGTKTSQSNKYEKVKYNNSNTVENKTVSVLTHKLIVRGGQVIGVELQDRNNLSYSKKTIAQLKNSGDPLYEALVNMNLYNESNDKSQTVLSTFEHKAGDTLNEGAYATLLAQTRQSVDGIATPDNAKVTEGSGWYSEDSTVLVVKEYITNYNVPSIAVSDKLSLTINGLNSPTNKNDFFSQMGKGHLYLRYDLNISTGAGNANPYFEFTTLNGYKGQNDNTWGKQGCTYLVPNVSVADTTRIN